MDRDVQDLRRDVQRLAVVQAELIGQLKATLPTLITDAKLADLVRTSIDRHRQSCSAGLSKGSIAKIGGLGGAFFLAVQALLDHFPSLL